MITTWEEFLADYEAKIDSTEIALHTGGPLDPEVLTAFEAPDHLGPLPESLRPQALELLRRNEELGRRFEAILGTIGRELADTTRAANGAHRFSPFSETVVPQYFDSRE